jgi:hypothetical protein
MKRSIILAIFLLLSCNGIAQQATAHLHLQVVDPSGARIPNAVISILKYENQVYRSTTNKIGETDFNLLEGKYTLLISANGFKLLKKSIEIKEFDNVNEVDKLQIGSTDCVCMKDCQCMNPNPALKFPSELSPVVPDSKIFIAEIPLQRNLFEYQCNLKGRKCKPIRVASH